MLLVAVPLTSVKVLTLAQLNSLSKSGHVMNLFWNGYCPETICFWTMLHIRNMIYLASLLVLKVCNFQVACVHPSYPVTGNFSSISLHGHLLFLPLLHHIFCLYPPLFLLFKWYTKKRKYMSIEPWCPKVLIYHSYPLIMYPSIYLSWWMIVIVR